MEIAREVSTLRPAAHSISMMYSLTDRLRSLRHRFWYGVSERVRWSRGAFQESPALELPGLPSRQTERIAALRTRYQVNFEQRLSAPTSLNNYEYLDILDRAWSERGWARPQGGVLCDVGSASFWYAATLERFFEPSELIGIEVEGHRLFTSGHTRIDYAAGYVAQVANARFIIADYLQCDVAADVITAWFPFVTAGAILAWRLPLSLLKPQQLFVRVAQNLRAGGHFVMVNHGNPEVEVAHAGCAAAGLVHCGSFDTPGVLSDHRARPAILSLWTSRPP
jgi:hypothetical protein